MPSLLPLNVTTSTITSTTTTLHYPNSSHLLGGAEDLDFFRAKILSRPLHAAILVVLVVAATTLNGLVILNIRKNVLKSRTVTFVLIQYMCVLDLLGSVTMLPFPFLVSLSGAWTLGPTACSVNAVVNSGVWIQHFVLFFLLKLDRASAACLPIGRYPLFKLGCLQPFLLLSLLFSFSLSTTLTLVLGGRFHQVVLLCTPKIPRSAYAAMLALYAMTMGTSALCYLALVVYLRRKQRRIYCASQPTVKDYRNSIHTAWLSFTITVTNLVVYVPTMLVLGQPQLQDILPEAVFLIVDIVFYAEFFLHPVVLLVMSSRLRKEIKTSVASFVRQLAC